MSLMFLLSVFSVSAASLISTYKAKNIDFSRHKCNVIERNNDIRCARVCMQNGCKGFEHRTKDFGCCIHDGDETEAKTNHTSMIYWENISKEQRNTDPPGQIDYLLAVSTSSLYVYDVTLKSWEPPVNTGAHAYGLLYIPEQRELLVTKYGEIHRSKMIKPKDSKHLELVFEKYITVSNSSIHGLAVDMSLRYLFTMGMCRGRETYGIIRVSLNSSTPRQKCVLSIAKGDSYFEDQIVVDNARKKLVFMSSFEKKMRECDYDGKKQRDRLSWRHSKVLGIIYNQATKELVYSERGALQRQPYGTNGTVKIDMKERPRCITQLGNNTAVMFDT